MMITKISGALLIAALFTIGCAKDAADTGGREGEGAPSGTVATAEPGVATHKAVRMEPAELKAGPGVVTIPVTTMMKECGSCRKHVSVAVSAVPAVEAYGVDNVARFVRVKLSEDTPEARQSVEDAIAKAGYSTDRTKRDEKVAAELPECCRGDVH